MLDVLLGWIRDAGAPTEKSTERSGFLSYHAESHALAMGIAGGFIATAAGETKLLSLVYAAAVYGRATERGGSRKKVFADIKQEMHYAVMGIVIGILAGLVSRYTIGEIPIETVLFVGL